MNRKLWKIIDSNARAKIRKNGNLPQRIYPFCNLSVCDEKNRDLQRYWNECARYVLEFRGGIWLDHPDQGF